LFDADAASLFSVFTCSPSGFAVFCLLHLYLLVGWVRSVVPSSHHAFLLKVAIVSGLVIIGFAVLLSALGFVPFLTGRLWTLLGATTNIAIVKSVSEHQVKSASFCFCFYKRIRFVVIFVCLSAYTLGILFC
jgi:hypothetical protein